MTITNIEMFRTELTETVAKGIATLTDLANNATSVAEATRLNAKRDAVEFAWNDQTDRLLHATTVDDILTIKEFIKIGAENRKAVDAGGTALILGYITDTLRIFA